MSHKNEATTNAQVCQWRIRGACGVRYAAISTMRTRVDGFGRGMPFSAITLRWNARALRRRSAVASAVASVAITPGTSGEYPHQLLPLSARSTTIAYS